MHGSQLQLDRKCLEVPIYRFRPSVLGARGVGLCVESCDGFGQVASHAAVRAQYPALAQVGLVHVILIRSCVVL